MEQQEIIVGDYVDYAYSKKVKYRGFIREIKGDILKLEVCLTKKINEDNITELVEVLRNDIVPVKVAA
ncbi:MULTISPECIES: hypothetical protein [unclassified Psychrobacillus]|uniref:hypothetical protein n=1 Tax=unclassified Psychrobacillus TaxID=2636677 RepID=UPI0030FACC9D